jgi:hypothetical protein
LVIKTLDLDLDPQLEKMLEPYPDPQYINADLQPWIIYFSQNKIEQSFQRETFFNGFGVLIQILDPFLNAA